MGSGHMKYILLIESKMQVERERKRGGRGQGKARLGWDESR